MNSNERKLGVLKAMSFGQRVAEEDLDRLADYFVETDQWRQLFNGQIDIVFGAKGSGKSALYFLIHAYRAHFRNSGTVLASAENPRGSPVFRSVSEEGSITELEFLALWKLYFSGVLATALLENDVENDYSRELFARLDEAGVWSKQIPLSRLLSRALEYVKRLFRPTAVQAGMDIDPVSGCPTGVTGKIIFSEPDAPQLAAGALSVDELLSLADKAFRSDGLACWILLDRLDVAFADSPELEKAALRALFRVYLDINGLDVVFLKIFLRTDIWARITSDGFREASHITRVATIRWSPNDLLNLCVRRLTSNQSVVKEYSLDKDSVLGSIESQRAFFYRVFPDKVDLGSKTPQTFDWILGRTRDSSRENAPRELIHFLGRLRELEARSHEIGEIEPESDRLFSRLNFRGALREVSVVRFNQTLLAEYPTVKDQLMLLGGQKAEHSLDSLAEIWRMDVVCSRDYAERLVAIGFFEKRGDRESPRYWIPFLYRDALSIVQGASAL